MTSSRIGGTPKLSLWSRIKRLALTDVGALARGMNAADLEAMEKLLLEADFGVPATIDLVEALEDGVRRGKLKTEADLHAVLEERIALLGDLEKLSKRRDDIVADAREVRRAYVGLKMKLEVLTRDHGGSAATNDEIEKVKSRLLELKTRFAVLKEDRIRIGEAIEEGDAKIDIIDEKLRETRQRRRGQASETFQVIGESNKEISTLRAETSLIDTKMRQLYAEIGRYVSRNAKQDPACAAATNKHHGLVDVMRALRRSIALNHRLAGTA